MSITHRYSLSLLLTTLMKTNYHFQSHRTLFQSTQWNIYLLTTNFHPQKMHFKKIYWFPTALRQLALSTIEEIYSSGHWLRVYNDSSRDKNGNSWTEVYSSFFTHFFPVSQNKQILILKQNSSHISYALLY